MAEKEKSPFQRTVEAGNIEMVKEMFNAGVVNDPTLSPLHLATQKGKKLVETLIERGVEQEQGRE